MPKSTLALKATVTRRQAEPAPSEMAERLKQLKHQQSAENAAVRPNEGATAPEPEKSKRQTVGTARAPSPVPDRKSR